MINFYFFLNNIKKSMFSEWVMLNQAVLDELGPESGGLRKIVSDKNTVLYREFQKYFKAPLLSWNE